MTRAEFIRLLAMKCQGLTIRKADQGVRAIIEELTVAFDEDKRVEIRNFGCFTTKQAVSRTGANPRTGEQINFGSHKVVRFKCGSTFHDQVNKTPLAQQIDLCMEKTAEKVETAQE